MAERKSQPIALTSMSSWPTDWHASTRYGTPAARVRAPISTAGFTRPPLVGTWVSDTSATSPPARASAMASTDTCPLASLGTRSTTTPFVSAARTKATAFAPYS